jgi:asparagine synthase (glutamine-hydrolysing)
MKVIYVMENGSVLSHERLSIIDLHSGKPIQGVVLPT